MYKKFGLLDSHDEAVPLAEVVKLAGKLAGAVVVYNDLSKVSETKSCDSDLGRCLTVDIDHLAVLGAFLSGLSTVKQTLKVRNCCIGAVTPTTTPDGVFQDKKGVPRGIFEAKNGTNSPSEGMRQAVPEATNLAVHQLGLGVAAKDIVIPVVASNGYLLQVGAVVVLEPSFPMFVMLTPVLDLCDDAMLLRAARTLHFVHQVITTELQFTQATQTEEGMGMFLNRDLYHLKPLQDFFPSTGNIQTSLFHFFKVMGWLHKSEECRPYVLFPLCVREHGDSRESTQIVFPKLPSSEYSIGLPSCVHLQASLLVELSKALTAFHSAGIVHLDFYPSNLMWRKVSDNAVQLKVVDWDSAHFISEPLRGTTLERLQGRRNNVRDAYVSKKCVGNTTLETSGLKYYDLSLLHVLQTYISSPSLQVSEKGQLDDAFIKLQNAYTVAGVADELRTATLDPASSSQPA